MNPDNKRVLLSLTSDQVDNLFSVLYQLRGCYETDSVLKLNDAQFTILVDWIERTKRIYDHMTDAVDIHYTDLGT